MSKQKKSKTMTEILRQSIAVSDVSYSELERETGVKRASIMRFVAGQRSLRLDKADALTAYFGLELKPKPSKKRK